MSPQNNTAPAAHEFVDKRLQAELAQLIDRIAAQYGGTVWITEARNALSVANSAHPDALDFLPLMNFLATFFHVTDAAAVTPAEYAECLYAIAKYSTFAIQSRLLNSVPTGARPN